MIHRPDAVVAFWLRRERQQARCSSGPRRLHVDLVEIAVGAGEDHADDLGVGQRRVLRLLHQLGQARAAVQQLLGRGVEVGAELREGRHLAVLRQFDSFTGPATDFIALVCAEEPTRDTDRPVFTAGRMPW